MLRSDGLSIATSALVVLYCGFAVDVAVAVVLECECERTTTSRQSTSLNDERTANMFMHELNSAASFELLATAPAAVSLLEDHKQRGYSQRRMIHQCHDQTST